MVEFPKILMKIKDFKSFYKAQTGICLKEIIQTPNKNFRKEIYKNIQTFTFQVL